MSGRRRTATVARAAALAVAIVIAPRTAAAAGLDGASLSWPWALPFAGLLLSIATGPLLFARLWHGHYGKIAFAWSTLTLAPLAALRGIPVAVEQLVHALLADYLSFIALLFALYVVAGGILITGNLRGTPWVNAAILALGTAIASVVGTTGAAMILIRPLLRANAARLVNAHEFIMRMDKGYASDVGQAGNRLSVGQRQLVSFARAQEEIRLEAVLSGVEVEVSAVQRE